MAGIPPPARKSFAASLFLPKTSFPMRPNSARFKQPDVIDRITTQAYRRQQQQGSAADTFFLLDGPPFANGQLHMGHFLNKILKDMFNRFQGGFLGKRVQYLPGWDCHGLPIELLVKKSASTTLADIRTRSREVASKAMTAQCHDFRSWGVLADWDTSYTTMDPKFEAKEMLVFRDLLASGLITRRLKPVYWSPKSQTALAEAELEYKDQHESQSVFVKFKVLSKDNAGTAAARYLVAWTTTPWSLTANMALAVNKDAEYVQVRVSSATTKTSAEEEDVLIVVAKARLGSLKQHLTLHNLTLHDDVSPVVPLAELLQWQCQSPHTQLPVPIITSDHVTLDSGTGIVHIAPLHGMEDFDCFLRAFPQHRFSEQDLTIDRRGRFKAGVLQGEDELLLVDAMTEGNARICARLSAAGLLLGPSTVLRHRYPVDWRTKTPIMIMATNQFFLQLAPHRAQEICSSGIQFVPESGRARLVGTIGQRREWCLSRQRVWGLPIPYYQHKHRADEIYITPALVTRFAELCKQEPGGSDFWFKDDLGVDAQLLPQEELARGCWQRGRDTLDVWFDSGSAWRSALPDNDALAAAAQVPDLVVEGSDQHRGWFQSSLLLKSAATAAIADPRPFKAVVTHGFVLDDKRQKMSKSLGNVLSPQHCITSLLNGNVDVLRLWAAAADCTGDVLMSQESLDRAADKMKKLRHLWRFFLSVGRPSAGAGASSLDVLDRAVLHALADTTRNFSRDMSLHQARLGINHVLDFVHGEELKAYIESRKDVLYCGQHGDARRQSTLYVLRQVLEQTLAMLQPVCVFTVDEILNHQEEEEEEDLVVLHPWRAEEQRPKYEQEAKALARVMRLRHELNQMNLPDDVQGSSAVEVTVTDEEGLLQLQRFITDDDQQWSNAAELLQVVRVSVKLGDRFAINVTSACDGASSTCKCARCRKVHPTAHARCGGEQSVLCDRCVASEAATATAA